MPSKTRSYVTVRSKFRSSGSRIRRRLMQESVDCDLKALCCSDLICSGLFCSTADRGPNCDEPAPGDGPAASERSNVNLVLLKPLILKYARCPGRNNKALEIKYASRGMVPGNSCLKKTSNDRFMVSLGLGFMP